MDGKYFQKSPLDGGHPNFSSVPYLPFDDRFSVEPSAPPVLQGDNNKVSSEYTPLLEDFTERFITRSQCVQSLGRSLPSDINSRALEATNQLPVPPELLLIHHQQSPFNPNLVASVNSSLSSFSLENIPALADQDDSNHCWRRFRFGLWFSLQATLFVGLMAFNFGSTMMPTLYSKFLITKRNGSKTSYISASDHEEDGSILIGFLVILASQFSFSLLGLISGLILLYSAHQCLLSVRKRWLLNSKFRNVSDENDKQSEQAEWSALFTLERIVAETLGRCMSKILSFILMIHQLCLCIVYIHLMFDYFDLLIISFRSYCQAEIVCHQTNQIWYMDHEVLCSIWLTLSVILLHGLISLFCMKNNNAETTTSITQLCSLWLMKMLNNIFGLIAMICTFWIIIDLNQTNSEKSDLSPKQCDIDQSAPIMEEPFGPLSNLDFDPFHGSEWYRLLYALPLLVIPFQVNEVLITLLFSQYDRRYYRKLNSVQDQHRDHNTDDFQYLIGSNQEDSSNQVEESLPLLYLSSTESMKQSMFVKFFGKSFKTIRNWYIMAIFLVFLFNLVTSSIFLNFQYSQDHHAGAKNSVEINFIREYFLFFLKSSTSATDHLIITVSTALILIKTTLIYLLVLFRGKIAQDWLMNGGQAKFYTRFQFLAPYIIWNCLALIIALLVQYMPWTLPWIIWLIGFFTIILLILCPSMLLAYFATKTLTNKQAMVVTRQSHQSPLFQPSDQLGATSKPEKLRFRPMARPKMSLLLAMIMLLSAIFYLAFWFYEFVCPKHGNDVNFVSIIRSMQNV